MKKRILSIVLSIVMLVSLLPTTALALETPSHTDHCVCGGSVTAGDHTHDAAASTWKAWNGEDEKPFASGIQVNTGNYYLTGNLTLSDTIRISGTVNLCLNGHSITTSETNAINVSSGTTLNICDCSEEGLGSISTTGDGSEGDVIYNYYGTVNVYGGSISAVGSRGDGIYNIGNGTKGVVNIYGGNISVETSDLYYGIRNKGGIVNVYDGSISALGDSPYGIYSTHSATVSGGTVSGSTSGIHNANADAILIVSGSASVIGDSYGISSYCGNLQLSGNPGITGGSADIRLDGGTNNAPTIGIDGVLANTEKYTVMTYQTPTTENPVVFTSAVDEGNADKFESADSAYQVIYEGGVLKLAVPSATPAHAHDMSVSCGGSGVTFEAWDGMGTPSGNVYLTGDVNNAITISSGTVNLCLNGYSITNSSGAAIEVKSGATLNICDCKDSGSISATASGSRGIENYGILTVYGGTVSGNTYGICNNYGGNVAVSGGTVSGGTGIENYGTLTVSGGSVTGTYDYGGYGISSYGTLKLSGAPAITGGSNSADVLIHAYQKVITIDGALTYSTPISVEPYNGYSAFTEGWNDKMPTADHNDYFIPASGKYVFVESSDELKPAYTVTYDANGAASGSVPVDSSSPYFYSNGVTVLDNTGGLAKEGYEFSGWNTKADGTGTHYAPESTFTIYSNTTLYAVWKVPHIHEYTYAVNTENAAQVIESCTCGHEETATVSGPTGTIVYDGTEKKGATVSYSTGWLGGTLTVTYVNNIYAGQATASITKAGATASVKFTINKAEPDYTLPMEVTATYGDTLEDIKISDWGSGWSWKEPTTSVGDVGTKTFVAVFKPEDTNNYNTVEAEVSVKVNAKQLTNPTIELSQDSFTYDGGENKPTVVTVKNGENTLISGVDYDITWPTDCTSVGTKTITVTFKGNYSGNKTVEYAIVAADSSCIAPVAVDNLVYTGSAQNLVTAATPTGGTVQYSLSEMGTFSESIPTGTDAGTYTVYYKVIGDANHNDTAVLRPVQVSIARKEVTVTAVAKTMTYGEAVPELTYTAVGLIDGQSLVGTLTRAAGNNAGTYDITQGTVTDENNPNYAITFVGADFVISKANQDAPVVGKVDETIFGKDDGKITGVTSAMEYRKGGTDTYTDIVGVEIAGLADGTYYVRLKGDSNHNPSSDTEVVVAAGRYLKVTFNSNGGSDIDSITGLTYGTVITAPTAPTKENATFAGWFSDSACTKAWNFAKDTVTADLTLYAKWSDVPVFHISGKVLEETDNENEKVTVSGATVELKLGTTLIATETTDENGLFYFGGQRAGDYNVVVTSGDKVVTVLVTLHDHDEDGLTVELPKTVTNSIVEHKPAADGKDSVAAGTLVGGLEDVAAAVRSENQSADKVEVKLTVKDTPPVTGTPTAGTEAAKQQAQQKAIQQKAGGKQLVFFDLSVVKTINGGAPEAITDTGDTLLEIRIPFDSGNKWGITIYRYHGDKAEVLAAVREGSTTEGFWVGDDGYIHIYTHKFSTYAVGYTVPSYGYFVPVTPDTVTSADTFDAGIVVYVTMSMLAATGSAVVIGKKRKEEN